MTASDEISRRHNLMDAEQNRLRRSNINRPLPVAPAEHAGDPETSPDDNQDTTTVNPATGLDSGKPEYHF